MGVLFEKGQRMGVQVVKMTMGDEHMIGFGHFVEAESKRAEILEPHEPIQNRIHEHGGVAVFDHHTPMFEVRDHTPVMLLNRPPINLNRSNPLFSIERLEVIL